MVKVGRPAALPRGHASGEHLHDLGEALGCQVAVRVRSPNKVQQPVLVPGLSGALRDDLLGEHVQRPGRDGQGIQVAPAVAPDERQALQQLVPREREEPPLRRAADAVARPPDTLEHQAYGARGPDLTHEIDGADVYAELQ